MGYTIYKAGRAPLAMPAQVYDNSKTILKSSQILAGKISVLSGASGSPNPFFKKKKVTSSTVGIQLIKGFVSHRKESVNL